MPKYVSNTEGLTEAKLVSVVLRGMFPQDDAKTRMSFALAIALENQGKHDEAMVRLGAAIGFEQAKA